MSLKWYRKSQIAASALLGVFLSALTMLAQDGENFQPGQPVEAMVSSTIGWQPCTVTENNRALNYMRVRCPSGTYMLGRRDVRAVQQPPIIQPLPAPQIHQPAPPSNVRFNPPLVQQPFIPGFTVQPGDQQFQVGQIVDVLLSSLIGWQPCTVTENNPQMNYMRVRCAGGVYMVDRHHARPTQNPAPYQPTVQQRATPTLAPPNTGTQPAPFTQIPSMPNPVPPQQLPTAPPVIPPTTTKPTAPAPEPVPEKTPEKPPVTPSETEPPPGQKPPAQKTKANPPPAEKPPNAVNSWIMAAPRGDGNFIRCQIMSKFSDAVLRVNCNECEGQPPKSQAVNVINTKPDDPAWKPPMCTPAEKPKEALTCSVEKPPAVDGSIAQPTDPLFRYLIFKDICGSDAQCGVSFKTLPIQQEFVNKADRPGGLLFSQVLEGIRMNPVKQAQYSVCRAGTKSEQAGDFVCFQDPALGNKWACKKPLQAPPAPPKPPPPPPQTCPVIGQNLRVPNNASLPFSTPLMLLLVAEEAGRFFALPPGALPNVTATIIAETGTNDSPVYGVRGNPVKTCQPQPDGTLRWIDRPSIGLRCFKSGGLQKWDCVIDDKYK